MHQAILRMLTACVAISTTIAFVPAYSMAQSGTPIVEADREAIEALVRRYYEIAASGELEALSDVLAPGFAIQNAPPGEDAGVDGLIFSLERARATRPDFTFRIEDLIVEGNAVVVRTTIGGTHRGDFFGVAPTGKWIEIAAIDLWHVENGKLAAVWHLEDILGMMEQLGMVPGGDPAGASAGSGATPLPAAGETSAATDASQVAANAALAQRFREEIFGQGNLDAAGAILSLEFVWHDVPPGAEGITSYASTVRAAFPDLTLTADEVVAEGDRVAILWTLTGTHQGAFLGAPSTGNSIATSGIDIYRIADGRIAEIWTVGDDLGLLFQLGAFPDFER
ncbi:MAG: ester cyclase [Thermomicrobiales bacterium]